MKNEKEEVVFEQPVRFKILPFKGYDRFIPLDTTPSVKNLETWVANNIGPITITDFDDGANEQRIKILGDGFTTVAHNANIKTSTGAAHLLAGNLIYVFTQINGVWYEDADLSGGGGVGPAGPQGPPGKDGINFVARDGKDGKDSLIPGPAGNQGPQGIQGIAGKNANNLLSVDGKKGDFGFPGPPGIQGNQGLQGVAGKDGSNYPLPRDGKDGKDGFPIPGPQGIQGVAGNTGAQGKDGQSIIALDGKRGMDGFSIPGPRGFQGIQGPTIPGLDGKEGRWGFPGPKGDIGPQGPQGPAGSGGGGSSSIILLPSPSIAGPLGFPGPPGPVDGTKISALPAGTFGLTTEFPANNGGVTQKITGVELARWTGDTIQNSSSATQAPTAATLTYLIGSALAVPVGKLRIGTQFIWWLDMTKSAAGIAARTFHVRIGTLGTTADAAVLTFTSALGTAVVDQAWMKILVTIRGPLTASCIARGMLEFDHELASTGFMTVKTEVLGVTSAAFDATVANLIVGLSVTTGASEVITFQQIRAEAKNL